jgi:hypothetical protein
LLGYKVSPTAVCPGGSVDVTLYWRAESRTDRDYAVFVHILSDAGTIVAQRDTYPGLGRYATTRWEAGVAFADRYRIHLPETAYSPDSGFVQVGIYLPGGPRLTTTDGRDAIRLEEIDVAAAAGDVPNPLNANFDGRLALVGYDYDRRTVRPGETISLTLYWRALSEIGDEYSVFAHIPGSQDQIWARSDGWPGDGRRPTTAWVPGEVVVDVRELTLDPATPPYLYQVVVGVYAPGEPPIPVVAEDGHWLDQRVLLSQIRVVDE